MTIQHLRAADRTAAPWRNGGGVTREVMIHPAGSDLAGFDWRVSIAEVASDGPFSTFAGIDRLMGVLSGNGLRLSVGDRPPVVVTPSSPPVAFSGDDATAGTLVDGPISDVNLMVRRGGFAGRMRRIDPAVGMEIQTAGAALTLWGAGCRLSVGGGDFAPDPHDALYSPGPARWRISAAGASPLWLIEVNPA